MAKIDITKIEGFDKMTAEEKIAALQAYEIPDPDYSGYVSKATFDKTASEVAEWKRKHNALLTEEEQKKQEAAEELESLRNKVAEMEKAQRISEHKAQYIALGYDEALAADTAQAMSDGNLTKVFANHKKFLEAHDKAYKAQLLNSTPTPPAGGGSGDIMTLEKFRTLSPQERLEYSVKNPEDYKKLYNNGGN